MKTNGETCAILIGQNFPSIFIDQHRWMSIFLFFKVLSKKILLIRDDVSVFIISTVLHMQIFCQFIMELSLEMSVVSPSIDLYLRFKNWNKRREKKELSILLLFRNYFYIFCLGVYVPKKKKFVFVEFFIVFFLIFSSKRKRERNREKIKTMKKVS